MNTISPYLHRITEVAKNADVTPTEFADRQQFLLTNPGLGGKLQVTSTIRCAVSIYNPGDVARAHMHSRNASRTTLEAMRSAGECDVHEGTALDFVNLVNGEPHSRGMEPS